MKKRDGSVEDIAKLDPLFTFRNPARRDRRRQIPSAQHSSYQRRKRAQLQIAAQQTQLEELKSIRAENAELKARLAEMLARLEQIEKANAARR
jgi:uncharacterized protein YhdP